MCEEKWYQDQQFWFSSLFSMAHFVRQCRVPNFPLFSLKQDANECHFCLPQLRAVIHLTLSMRLHIVHECVSSVRNTHWNFPHIVGSIPFRFFWATLYSVSHGCITCLMDWQTYLVWQTRQFSTNIEKGQFWEEGTRNTTFPFENACNKFGNKKAWLCRKLFIYLKYLKR